MIDHDSEKWKPIFGQDHAQNKESRPGSDSVELDHGLEAQAVLFQKKLLVDLSDA